MRWLIMLVLALVLVGCGGETPATPTAPSQQVPTAASYPDPGFYPLPYPYPYPYPNP